MRESLCIGGSSRWADHSDADQARGTVSAGGERLWLGRCPRPPGCCVPEPEYRLLVRGEHHDPHSILGAHPTARGTACSPSTRRPPLSSCLPAPARRSAWIRSATDCGWERRRAWRAARPIGSGSNSPMAPTGNATTRIGSCQPSASSTCTSSARAPTSACGMCSARTRACMAAWRAWPSPSGRRTPAACAWSATSTAGTGASSRCARWAPRASGSCSCRASVPASSTSTRCWAPTGSCASRPTRSPSRSRCGPRPHHASGTSAQTTAGPMTTGWPTAPAATHIGHRCRSTRSTWARGAATGTAAGSATDRPPSSWRSTAIGSASPTSSCCRLPSTPSTDRGATRSPAITRPPPASAAPMTSAPWSTRCTAPGSA